MAVVHRHPGATADPVESALRRLRPEWKQKIGKAPVGLPGRRRPISAIERSPRSVDDVIFGRTVGDRPADHMHILRIDRAEMQKAEMRSVNLAFERLQP